MAPDNPSTSAAPLNQTRLTGWKEIAAFFGKGVRTVQRWEKELGLPVHRIGTGAGETVYALVSELEAWQRSRGDDARAQPTPGDAESGAHQPLTASAGCANLPRDAAPAADSSRPRASDTSEHGRGGNQLPAPARPAHRRWLWPAGVGAILATAVVAVLLVQWLRVSPSPPQPAQYRVEGNKLIISDRSGKRLWDYPFEFPLTPPAYSTPWATHPEHPSVVFHDIEGDGQIEVLFVHEPWLRTSRGLYCFRRDGKLLFHHEPDYRVVFGDKQYAAPWRAAAVYVTGPAKGPHDIWFVSGHQTEFPTVLEKLDTSGNPKSAYWSNGQILSVVAGDVAGRSLLFVGAISNEFTGGSLAILEARDPSGSAPARSDHYRCTGCPPGVPLAFFVFPPLDVTTAIGGYSMVTNAFVEESGRIWVDVCHDVGQGVPQELHDAATSHYILDSQFRVIGAELGTRFARAHAEFERRDLLKHPFDAALEARTLFPVIRWRKPGFEEVGGLETGAPR